MKTHATSAELKARARQSLTGHYLTLCGAFITFGLLQYLISIPTTLMNFRPPLGMILYYAATLALNLFFAIFEVGFAYMFLSNACRQPINSGGLFHGFWNNPMRAVQLQLFPALLLLFFQILPQIYVTLFFNTQQGIKWLVSTEAGARWLLYGIIVFALSEIPTLYIQILYSQIFYISLDFPEMSPRECLRQSRRMMKGNKLRYLYIWLSFLPLTFLGMLSCGIGLLYVLPYREQTFANFYLELMEQDTQH